MDRITSPQRKHIKLKEFCYERYFKLRDPDFRPRIAATIGQLLAWWCFAGRFL